MNRQLSFFEEDFEKKKEEEKENKPIPGTRQLPIADKVLLSNEGELFCFCIQELNSTTYLHDFIENLNSFLPNYVFSLKTLEAHKDKYNRGLTKQKPLDIARKLLQKTTLGRTFNSGELGEFLLYLFAKEVKGAHKLATKIHARGSVRMTITGRDNTFAWKDENGEIYMLVGEAKMESDSNDGLRSAQQDLNRFWTSTDDTNHEITLASTHIREEMTEENIALYEAYFIDDNPAHQNLRYKNIVFVGYSLDKLTDLKNGILSESDFIENVCTDLTRCFSNQKPLIEASPYSSIYCFIPFESIDSARNIFAITNNLIIPE